MNRISGANFAVASGASPLVAPAGVAVFQDLNLGTNTPGTYPNALWFTGAQESIMAVLAAAGIAPADTDNTQLLAAIRAVPAGRFLNVQVFTASGVYTPTPGTNSVIVTAVGGGGAGGGAPATGSGAYSVTSGGQAGATARGRFTAGFSGLAVTIGGGGVPAPGGTGGSGGTSSLGTLISSPGGAGGGVAGPSSSAPINSLVAYVGSPPAGGNIFQTVGHAGSIGACNPPSGIAYGGRGGSTAFGGGGVWEGTAQGYGSGGGGQGNSQNSAAVLGYSGTQGIVFIEEYS